LPKHHHQDSDVCHIENEDGKDAVAFYKGVHKAVNEHPGRKRGSGKRGGRVNNTGTATHIHLKN